jgi:hypothetical protein
MNVVLASLQPPGNSFDIASVIAISRILAQL